MQRAFDEIARGLQRRRGPLPARAERRPARRRRPAAHEPARREGGARDLLQDLDTPCVLDRRRTDAVGRRATGLDAHPRLRHRRRQPHVSHRDPGAFARRAGRRRPARCQRGFPPAASVIVDGDTARWSSSRAPADRQEAEARARLQRRRRPAAPTDRRTGDDGGRRPHPTAGEHRTPRRRVDGARVGRGGHRAVSIGVHARRRPAGHAPARTSSTMSTGSRRRNGAADRSPSARSTSTNARSHRPMVDTALDARWFDRTRERTGHAGLRGIRFGLAQPAIFKTQLRALLRAARTARCASCSRSSRPCRRCARRGRCSREARPSSGARHRSARRADRHHDRSAVGGVHRRRCWRARSISSPSAPTI